MASRKPQSWLSIENIAALPGFDIDDPQVGIELAFAGDELGCGGGVDPFVVVQAREAAHAVIARLALRRRAEARHPAVETIENDEDGASLLRAAFAQGRERALDGAAAQIGGNPDVGAKARNAHGIAIEARAESALSVRGFNSPVTGNLAARSNFWIAPRVPGPINPSASRG